jgi:ERF superfamily protein
MEANKTDLEEQLRASLDAARERGRSAAATAEAPIGSKGRGRRRARVAKGSECATNADLEASVHPGGAPAPIVDSISPVLESCAVDQMTLRQKLGEVRRRIGYIQKRGYNEHYNYNYVTAADIAGTVGDILAELGVVVIPRLESITYERHAPGRLDRVSVARVIMAYSFTDVNSGEEITARVAGEGLDAGDKAPYKAMTGALKYALLQSFLLATGDDPEEDRTTNHSAASHDSVRLVMADDVRELERLIGETGTELERVLAYYKLSSLEQMSEATYQRALELLNRKKARQTSGKNAHAPN